MTDPAEGNGGGRARLADLGEISLDSLKGVGPRNAEALAAMGLNSVLDLLMHYPRRLADRSSCLAIADLSTGTAASVQARVARVESVRLRSRRTMVRVELVDEAGDRLNVTFFNQPWRARQLQIDMGVVVFGKAEPPYRSSRVLSMTNPRVDLVDAPEDRRETGRIVAIYPQSEKAGVVSFQLARYVAEALTLANESGALADPLSERRRSALELVSRAEAFQGIHRPATMQDYAKARRRLAFDELWRLQVVLVMRKRAAALAARGISHAIDGANEDGLVRRFVASLPFPLTAAQTRVIEELAVDLANAAPMHRLLQGDVGAGKTVVALAALLYGAEGGYQGALMVPTEVLAEQHFLAARRLLGELSVPDPSRLSGERPLAVALLTSRTPGAERARLHGELRSGAIDLLVGTHALITEDVAFHALGVVVIDEQHRFGVDQRAALREKGGGESGDGHDPDLLVMTATPIPRTAAMTVYGDLDYSVLDELPAGRAPVKTVWIDDADAEHLAWERVRAELDKGHAAYVVCPLVRAGGSLEEGEEDAEAAPLEDADPDGLFETAAPQPTPSAAARSRRTSVSGATPGRPLRATIEEHARLSATELAGYRVGLLHGQLPAREKEEVMAAFRRGDLQVLVATTVIEVGLDVPSATVMVISDADRFGIAQLHQLRGRVGRAKLASWCFLLGPEASTAAAKRLEALAASTDGFELAETDLELRGEGTVLGVRQKGRNDLRLASLRRDKDLVLMARGLAEDILAADPSLAAHPRFLEELALFVGEEEAQYLQRS